jgi:predicted nucleotidyltransferase
MGAMLPAPSAPQTAALLRAAQATSGLELLLLFGSRARDEAHAGSDWDVGYVAAAGMDVEALRAAVVDVLGTDRVDLVDLRRASGLLRYRAARDGRPVFEARPGLGDAFVLDAVRFWCDAAPLLQRGYEDVLAELTR